MSEGVYDISTLHQCMDAGATDVRCLLTSH